MKPNVILASGSQSRQALLAGAGVEAETVKPNLDEDAFKSAMRAQGASVADQAMRLAELKAIKVSEQRAGLTIGGDQMLSLGNRVFDKPEDMDAARTHLEALSGQTHRLETAIVVAEEGRIVWRHLAQPELTMRPLTLGFIDKYIATLGDDVLSTVGSYKLESLGSQLFSEIKGDYFSILGLPLLPLLDYLRIRGVIAT